MAHPAQLLGLHQGVDDPAERGERLVDVHGLLEVLALRLRASKGASLCVKGSKCAYRHRGLRR